MTENSASPSGDGSASRTFQVVILLCFGGAMLGLSTILARLSASAGLPPLAFLTWSLLGASVCLTVVARLRGAEVRLTGGRLPYFAIAGLFSVAAPNAVIFLAAPRVGAGFVALSIAFPPLLTWLGSLLVGIERFDRLRAIGVALALAGAVWLALGKVGEATAPVGWVAVTLLIPVFLSVGNVYRTLRWPAGARPDELAPGMLAAAGVMTGAVALIFGQGLRLPLEAAWVLLVAQIAVFTLQFLTYFVLQKKGGPVVLSLLGAVAAVVTVPLSVAMLAEALPTGLGLGALLIAAGIALVTTRGKAQR